MKDLWTCRLDELAARANGSLWQLAEFALDARDEGIPGWATLMGRHKFIRRSPSTIFHWARAAEVWRRYPRLQAQLPFSAFELLAYWEGGVDAAQLQVTIEEFLADGALTVDDLRRRLQELFGEADTAERATWPVWELGSPTVQALMAENPATPVVLLTGWADVQAVRVTAARERTNGR